MQRGFLSPDGKTWSRRTLCSRTVCTECEDSQGRQSSLPPRQQPGHCSDGARARELAQRKALQGLQGEPAQLSSVSPAVDNTVHGRKPAYTIATGKYLKDFTVKMEKKGRLGYDVIHIYSSLSRRRKEQTNT